MGNRLTDRVAIVTGGGRGIGREVALWLARDGAKVVVNDVGAALDGTGDSGTPADQVVNEIISEGGKAVASYDSVAEFDSAEQIVNTALNNYGRIDILCHPAGILRDRMIFNMTEAEWDAVLQVHLYGAFNMVRNVAPHMIEEQYGRIVLFSSGSGLGASGQANYAAAKEGMVGFTRAVSKELESHGIMINAVYPGGSTRMTDSIPQSTTDLRQTQRAQAGQNVPKVSLDPPPEYRDPANNAPKVVYLCSEAADGITGQVFGTSGWELSLYSPRHVVKSIHKNEAWSLEELERLIPISLGRDLINPAPAE
jgi:NAD(P)-dependent dehydrogenase (short-subunit alcohol dehydrogenase family)|tara:strand:- start:489 stop:1418 length:930 start_codon:yes stop_codon:yes gene_type:complete